MPPTSVIIHGHFYQPPRDNPWLEEVEVEPSAAPAHDWNARIEQECYRAVVAARLVDGDGRIASIVNTLERISFNFGPTLLDWMERQAPDTFNAVIAADRASVRRLGHGNALAHPFHHVILPLSPRRDKVTEVRWGIADFRRRFGRDPEGMWLPETAVDDESLDVLAEHGIRFAILAPHQAEPIPPKGLPGLYRTRNGRSIALFFYDGGLSHDVAFGALLKDAHLWADRMAREAALRPGGTLGIASDGETYGHHHRFADMALARMLDLLERREDIRVENYAAVLARQPATHEVSLVAPTSWSCAHGVERWRAECGCRIAPDRPSQQQWRAPLRQAVEWLAGELHGIFEREGASLLGDPWQARDRYDPSLGVLPGADPSPRALELLEMERNALRLFTSCAWFFDDLAGIEPVQVLRYGARAIELAGPAGGELEAGFIERLARAKSNDAEVGNGRDLYLAQVRPRLPTAVRVAGGLAALADVAEDPGAALPAAWEARVHGVGPARYAVELVHRRTRATAHADVACRWAGPYGEFISTTEAGSWPLHETDLWDRHQPLLRAARQRHLIHAALTDAERGQLADGVTTLPALAPIALLHALGADSSGPIDVRRAHAVLDLLAFLGLGVPFDAQSRFAAGRAEQVADPSALGELAVRLGFGS